MQVEKAKAENVPIRVTLPDGTTREGVKGATTPQEIVSTLSRSLAKKALAAKVDGEVWDIFRPLERDCQLQILTFDDPDGKEVYTPDPCNHIVILPGLLCLWSTCTFWGPLQAVTYEIIPSIHAGACSNIGPYRPPKLEILTAPCCNNVTSLF